MSAVTALLELERARIDAGGAPLIDGLSVSSAADRVALVGDWHALFALLGAQASLASGRVTLNGCDAAHAVSRGVVGLALWEPTLPPSWTAEEYLGWSARLTGLTAKVGKTVAAQTLQALGLAPLARRKLGTLMPMERRALLIAHASLGSPAVLALDRPLARLDDPAQRWLSDLMQRAASGRRLLVSVEDALSPGAERALVESMHEVLVAERGSLVAQGPAASALDGGGRYLVTVLQKAAPLARRLVERGLRVELTTGSGTLEAVDATGAPISEEAARLVVTLPQGTDPGSVIEASAEVDAPVVELVALGRSGA